MKPHPRNAQEIEGLVAKDVFTIDRKCSTEALWRAVVSLAEKIRMEYKDADKQDAILPSDLHLKEGKIQLENSKHSFTFNCSFRRRMMTLLSVTAANEFALHARPKTPPKPEAPAPAKSHDDHLGHQRLGLKDHPSIQCAEQCEACVLKLLFLIAVIYFIVDITYGYFPFVH